MLKTIFVCRNRIHALWAGIDRSLVGSSVREYCRHNKSFEEFYRLTLPQSTSSLCTIFRQIYNQKSFVIDVRLMLQIASSYKNIKFLFSPNSFPYSHAIALKGIYMYINIEAFSHCHSGLYMRLTTTTMRDACVFYAGFGVFMCTYTGHFYVILMLLLCALSFFYKRWYIHNITLPQVRVFPDVIRWYIYTYTCTFVCMYKVHFM